MIKRLERSERGQAIVLMVLAIVVIFGFTALAVDGSMIYSDRRYAQNIADSAALAGGAAAVEFAQNHALTRSNLQCNSNLIKNTLKNAVINASKENAQTNGKVIEANITNKNGVEMTCNQSQSAINIHVVVTHATRTAFAHLVYGGDMKNTVDAIVEVKLGDSGTRAAAGGLGLLALDEHARGALRMTGSGRIGVAEGGIQVNSDDNEALQVTGSGTLVGNTIAVVGGNVQTGSGDIEAVDTVSIGGNSKTTGSAKFFSQNAVNVNGNLQLTGSGDVSSKNIFVGGNLSLTGSGSVKANSALTVNGTVSNTGSGKIQPTPQKNGIAVPVVPMPDPLAHIDIPAPAKPAGAAVKYSLTGSKSETINPGLYQHIKLTGSATLTLNSGLYYILDDFSVTGSGSIIVKPGTTFYIENGSFSMTGSGNFSAPQVMFYLGPNAKDFKLTGSGGLSISAQGGGPYQGLTLYIDRTNTKNGAVSVTGSGSVASVNGTFYVPTREIVLTGSGSTNLFNAQVICRTAELTGSGDFSLNYDDSLFFQAHSDSDLIISLVK